jgi:hypothetical protein
MKQKKKRINTIKNYSNCTTKTAPISLREEIKVKQYLNCHRNKTTALPRS